MTKARLNNRLIALLLVVTMMIPMCAEMLPLDVFAAVGDLANIDTGLTGDIDTADTISLPIKILDYEADGMLFDYAEAYADADGREVGASKEASDFGATWAVDFASQTAVGNIDTSMYGDFWSNTTKTLITSNTYASYLRVTWAKNSTQAPHTVYGRTGVIIPNDINLSPDNARYLLFVYRSNVASGKIGFFVERANADRNNTNNRVGDLTFTSEGATNWTYEVYDLKQGNLANTWNSYGNAKAIWTTLPMDSSGEYIDLAHVALFANRDQAEAFGEYALTDGSDRGDNRGFGLLRGSRKQDSNGTADNGYGGYFNGIFKYGDAQNTITQINTYGDTVTSYDYSSITNLGYKLLGTFKDNGIANVGLLDSALSAEGYPVYKQEVVTYVANLLKPSLEIPERTSDGWKNYRYVKGEGSSIYGGTDLATALRTKINKNMGTYAQAAAKDLVGTWPEVGGNIASYYDAAYFLLNSIFVPGSYNVEQNDYKYLVLSSGIDAESGKQIYVFDAGFTDSSTPESAKMAIDYDTDKDTIQNSSAAGKSHFVYEGDGRTTTLNPFLPVTSKNTEAGQTTSHYYQDDGIINTVKKQDKKDTYYKRNFNYALVSSGEFVYHADDELFFDFEGDDDVYLFINGELVMDIGSAHSIDGVRFELNDYVNAAKAGTLGSDARNEKLSLVEGNTYEFKFYYMERHGYGANMRIETNIRVTDPTMTVQKTAYQEGVQLDFGSIINKDMPVEYGFTMTNTGERALFNLIFNDETIGIKFDGTQDDNIPVMSIMEGKNVFDPAGDSLTIEDIVVTLNGEQVNITNETDLRNFLCHSIDGNGFKKDDTVTIRGFAYKLSEAQVKAGVFDNTVLVQSNTNPLLYVEYLYGQASMRVFVPADPMYYQWAGHELKVTKTKLVEDILAAANQEGNILAGKVPNLTVGNVNKIEPVTKAGNPISYDWVSVDGSHNLTINSKIPGSRIFYVKITYNSSKNSDIVPVLVNITAVEDNYIVLDYGLPVDIQVATLKANDTVTVPGRATMESMLGIGAENTTPSYSPNEISFTLDDDGIIQGTYGTFKFTGNVLTYTPTSFIEGPDSIWLAVNVYETDITPSKIDGTLNINREVEMYQKVTIVPANVMYYEDNFETINFFNENDEPKLENSIEVIGSSDGYKQSDDQAERYGHDSTYAASSNTDKSGGTITKIALSDKEKPLVAGEMFNFDFTGTGFEIIARTNAYDTGTLVLEVEITPYTSTYSLRANAENTITKRIPVITEFDNGGDGGSEEVYQISIARVENLECSRWHVSVKSIIAYDYTAEKNEDGSRPQRDTNLYLDGIRIFNPYALDWDGNGTLDGDQYYIATEQNAQFVELRKKIVSGGIAVVETADDGNITISTSTTTWTENRNGTQGETIDANEVNSVNDYLIKGPNNEVYLYGEDSDAALVFYVDDSDKGTAADIVSSLQIAARAIDDGSFVGAGALPLGAEIRYGVQNGDSYAWTPLVTLVSATEQYYEIDYTKCPYVEGKGYQVAIKVEAGMAAFTSLKLVDLILSESNVGTAATLQYVNGILYEMSASRARTLSGWTVANVAAYPAFNVISAQMSTDEVVSVSDENTYTIPDCDHKIIVTPSKPSDPNDPTPDEDASITGTLAQLLARAEKTLVDENGINWGYYPEFGWRAICLNKAGTFQLCTAGEYMILTNRPLPMTGYGMSGNGRVKYYFAMGEWQAVGDDSFLSAAAMMQVLLSKNPIRLRGCADPTIANAVYDEQGIMWIKRNNGTWGSTRQIEYSGDKVAKYIDSLERVWIMNKATRTWILENPPALPGVEQTPEIEVPADPSIDPAKQFAADNGLFNGIDEKLIADDAPLSRSMLVVVLGRLADVDVTQFMGTSFADVSADQLYAPYVEWSAKSGTVTGVSATEFAPNAEVTVEQAVVFLARYAEYVGKSTASKQQLDTMADATAVSSWAADAMRWAVETGVYTGINGKLEPQAKASCALVMQMIYAFSVNAAK